MGVERYGSKTDVVVKLVLVFFIALLSFSIGTFVGKKFSDNEYARKQMEPGNSHASTEQTAEHEGEARGVASVHPDANDLKPDKALTDEEIAKLAEEFVAEDDKSLDPAKAVNTASPDHAANSHEATGLTADHAAVPSSAATAVTAASRHDQQPSREILKPAARMAEGKSAVIPNPAKAPSRIPSALPTEVASSAVGKYTVQVAAYQTEKEAQSMAADLKNKGFSAFYVSAKVKGKTFYRVSVGLFTTPKEAESYKKDLLTRAKVSAAIVQKITSAE